MILGRTALGTWQQIMSTKACINFRRVHVLPLLIWSGKKAIKYDLDFYNAESGRKYKVKEVLIH